MPARNTVFLALALAWAETLGITDIFIGANALDYSGYPDCRPEFIAAFEKLANLATKAGAHGAKFRIHAPLIELSKADIIRRAFALKNWISRLRIAVMTRFRTGAPAAGVIRASCAGKVFARLA